MRSLPYDRFRSRLNDQQTGDWVLLERADRRFYRRFVGVRKRCKNKPSY
jgi:hypothetical protein